MKNISLKLGLLSALITLATWMLPVMAHDEEDSASHEDRMMEHRMHRDMMIDKMKQGHGKQRHDRLEGLDTNDDGQIDLSEYLTNAENRFNQMDVNGDQYVTSKEARETHKRMRKEQHKARMKAHKQRKQAQAERHADTNEAEVE